MSEARGPRATSNSPALPAAMRCGISAATLEAIRGRIRTADLVGQRVALSKAGRLHRGCCPFHREESPSFYVYPDHYHCFGCGAHGVCFTWLMKVEGLSFHEAVAQFARDASIEPRRAYELVAAPRSRFVEPSRTLWLARLIWTESVSPAGTLVECYLAGRDLRLPMRAPLRYGPQCPRGDDKLPAMVALMTDAVTRQPTGLHRTFLLADGSGKAQGVSKMKAGRAGIIRLIPDADVTLGLSIAEGIETALAITQHAGWTPVWAAGDAGSMGEFPVLPGIESLTLFVDRDDSGASLKAAQACTGRWRQAGREVTLQVPPAWHDWHDALAGRLP